MPLTFLSTRPESKTAHIAHALAASAEIPPRSQAETGVHSESRLLYPTRRARTDLPLRLRAAFQTQDEERYTVYPTVEVQNTRHMSAVLPSSSSRVGDADFRTPSACTGKAAIARTERK